MSAAIPTQILSDALHQRVAGRRIEASVFTAYCFEPGFFEQEVIPALFSQSFSHAPRVRLVQLEEALRETGPVAVYFDRRGLTASTQSAALDIQRVPITHPRGVFHPKLVLVLLAPDLDADGLEVRPRSLVAGTLSANLTRSGWWENVECAWLDEVEEGSKCGFRGDLLELLTALKKEDATGGAHPAVDHVWSFLRYRVNDTTYASKNTILHPRIHWAQGSLPEFLEETLRLPADTYNLEVISPFFDQDAGAGSVTSLIEKLAPKEVRIYEPRGDDGAIECDRAFHDAVRAMRHVSWANFAGPIRRRGSGAEEKETPRYVHAKVYRLWSQSQREEYVVIGSANMTRPGHAGAYSGNFEAVAVSQVPYTGKLGWWLEPVETDAATFRSTSETDEGSGEHPPPLSVRFDWEHRAAAYFWESHEARLFVLSSDGEPLAQVAAPSSGDWMALPSEVSARLAEKLRSTSVLDVAVAGEPLGSLLVAEIGMAHKPSILLSLTPEEILRYWSLLSAEQREAFLEKKAYQELVARGLAPPRPVVAALESSSMFDRFAGVFHAFEQLEEHVRRAFEEGREGEVVYRLFGEKYDSLPQLLDKVVSSDPKSEGTAAQPDPLLSYVTVLTAESLVRRLRSDEDHHAFFARHTEAQRRLDERFQTGRMLREKLKVGADADTFLRWFEKWFMRPAKKVVSA